jgi:2',3'-cyclic-nucleotide 2'-phosphodiesterase (5'-nucleotidase family)
MKFAPTRVIRLLIAIILVLIVAGTLCWADRGDSGSLLKLTIMYMNDPHAHYVPYSKEGSSGLIGGFGKARTVMSELQAQNRQLGKHTLIFLAGDLLMGTPFSTAFKGQLGVTLMNTMQFDAMVVGNHDFDYGQDNLMSNVKSRMKFPLISANIKTQSGDYVFQRSLIKDISNPKSRIVILGLTTADTPVTTFPDNVKDLVFDDPIRTAQEVLQGVKNRDLVIALTHLGVEEDKRLAEACPKIDIIIGGHSHTALFKPIKVNNAVICQAGAYAEYVGKLDLEVQDGRVIKYDGELIFLGPEIKED